MQECDLSKVGRRASSMVYSGAASLVCVNPALRQEFITTASPELRAAIDCVRTENNSSSLRNMLSSDSRVADRFTDCCRNGWVQTENLLADAVQKRHRFQIVPGNWGVT